MSEVRGSIVEIIERTKTAEEIDGLGIIRPNEVRIDGVPIRSLTEDGIEVHSISIENLDVVKVTLTLFARRVVIGVEEASE